MLISSGKMVFIVPTVISVIASTTLSMAAYYGLAPIIGTIPTMLLCIALTVVIVAAVSYKWIVAPLQGSMEHVSARVEGESDKVEGKHGFTDNALRANARIGDRYERIANVIDEFYELAGGLVDGGSEIAIAAAEVSFTADKISKDVHDDVEHISHIADSSTKITEIVKNAARNAASVAEIAEQTRGSSEEGQAVLNSAVEQMRHTNGKAEEASEIIASLESKSDQIQQITSVISGIAEQTNLLALNAAIEAARAGDQGRGFAVVADEVRSLAQKTAEATSEIGSMVTEIGQDVQQAVNTMSSLVEAISEGASRTERVGEKLSSILEQSEIMQQQVAGIAKGTEENHAEVDQISHAINSVSEHLNKTEVSIDEVAKQAGLLSNMSEKIHAQLMGFNISSFHNQMRDVVAKAAGEVQQMFEESIAAGQLSTDDVFDRNYKPIQGTNPQKFTTRFDDFSDRNFPGIQEPILSRFSEVAYAGAVDNNGYFPTHNKCYSKPLTGDYETDLLSNRTKRIFDDPTGSRCAKNTEPFLLQTYKRDTGEVMHDISVPIYVNGRHWGGFRLGYKAT